jgi:acetolactate decarboxylase
MIARRHVLKMGLIGSSCALCGGIGGTLSGKARAETAPTSISGVGYELWFVGAQRETMAQGKLGAILDLRTLANEPDLYGIGPIEQLRGEVTVINSHSALASIGADGRVRVRESFETGVPFFVWTKVPLWRPVPVPAEVRSFEDLERYVPKIAAAVGLDPDKPLPFLLSGRADLIEFHILHRTGVGPYSLDMLKQIQVPFTGVQEEAAIIGFYSAKHRGIFTPADSDIHLHFQTPDNSNSGHVTKLELGQKVTLSLPASRV